MTPNQRKLIQRLGECHFYPESWDKRFVKDMLFKANSPDWEACKLSPRQSHALLAVGHRYREQLRSIPDPETGNQVADLPAPGEFAENTPAQDVPDLPQQPSLF